MIYLKSVLAGLIALIATPIFLVGLLAVGMFVHTLIHPPQGEGSIGWDPVSLYRTNPFVWCIPLVIFLAGFFWEYRRAAR
jgi:uncharacterized BrkB/YihY/UPF0761 family membrane protein